ncbi:diguanylate cyclase [Anaerovorax odorimutans]|uniref:Diguanylate cyclase n=1 Tax=Anaerovorax odorimutans TaxID=109327 RepID=A0ABT1RSP4_9FIRM|nr:diguanylate cyclase [Anaerovorax odorimutans]MCQ4638169.1 diguanylate cyclase [Anaerovorax odorimutans]
MYHCQLNIHILNELNEKTFWESALEKLIVPEGLSVRVRVLAQTDGDILKDSDILIIDLEEFDSRQIQSWLKKDARLILCGNAGQIAQLQETLGHRYDEVWARPFEREFATARTQRILEQIKTEKELWITRNYLDTTIDSIPDLVWFKDIRGAHLKVNDAFCEAVGKTKEDVQGRGHYYIWDLEPEDYAKGEYVCLETEEEVLRRKETCLFDERVKSKNGLRQFKTYKSPVFGQDGQVLGTVGIAHDVTDLENVATELEIVLQSMPFAILVKNSEGIIINTNHKFTEYFGMPAEEIAGMDFEQWKEQLLKDITEQEKDGYMETAIQVDGQERILEIHKEPIYDIFSDLVGELCICREVTGERMMEQQILHNAHTDFMTGLNNRRYFYEYMAENRGDQEISMIYVDMDGFKQVNDTYGHKAGDEALILTARLMEKCFPQDFITRLGGDEFLITILGPCQASVLRKKALALQEEMLRAFRASEQLKQLSASIGIAQSSDPEAEIDTVLRESDMALYRAKQLGRGRCCVYGDDF